MNILQQVVNFIQSLLVWWFIVEPWEQAVRVRFGKRVRLYVAGLYFKIPFFDVIYKQNIRRRVSAISPTTTITADGCLITLSASIGYRIVDVLLLQNTLHDAEHSVKQEVLGRITEYVVTHALTECHPSHISAYVTANAKLEKYGLGDFEFFVTGYVSKVRTYRLIQDSLAMTDYSFPGLTTQQKSYTGPQ